MKKDNSLTLDSYRGCAALVVAVCHAFQIFISPFASSATKYVGLFSQASVMVFFVLSGFLIGNSAINNLKRNGTFDVSSYAKDRAMRIYPPLILSVVIMFVLSCISPFIFPSGTVQLSHHHAGVPAHYSMLMDSRIAVSLLTFMNGLTSVASPSNAALWSLPLEVWYYAIVGFALCKSKVMNIFSIFIIIFGAMISKIFILYGFVWFVGFFISFLYTNKYIYKLKFASPLSMILSSVTLFFSIVSYVGEPSTENLINYNISAGLFFASIIYFMHQWNKLTFTSASNTARYSYTLYIIHFPVYLFIYGCINGSISQSFGLSAMTSLLSLCLVVFMASQMSKYVENKDRVKKILSA